MSSDQDLPNNQTDASELIGENIDGTLADAEQAIDAAVDPASNQVQMNESPDQAADIDPEPAFVPPIGVAPALPPDLPGKSSTTGTGTSIAVGCTAVCAVILIITVLILTIVS